MSYPRDHRGGAPAALIGVAVIAVIAILVLLFGVVFAGLSYTDAAKVGVVRNGGLFDNTNVRTIDGKDFTNAADPNTGTPEVIPPGSSYTWVGLHSTVHEYPATGRSWRFDSNGGADTDQQVNVPTRDGVLVGLEGQFTFGLNQDPKVLGEFDNKYGIRSYPTPEGGSATPSDGSDAGWNAFLRQYLPNIVNNSLRQKVGVVECRDLVASCSLVQNGASAPAGQVASTDTTATLTAIQSQVDTEFGQVLNQQLGGDYFTNVHLSLSKVDLPQSLQDQVNAAQAAYAQVSQSQAKVQSAQQDALANETKQQGYNACQTCAQVDILHALPPGLLTYAPGGGAAIAVPAGR